jgi:hypothetical protein
MKRPPFFLILFTLLLTNYSSKSQIEIIWQKRFGGSYDEQAKAIIPSGDGGFILSGWTKSSGAGGKDALIIKIDSKGETVWEKTFGKTDDDYVSCAQLSPEGNYIIGGTTKNIQTGNYCLWVFALDKLGKQLWEYVSIGSEWDAAKSIVCMPDGYAIAAVHKNKGDQDKESILLKLGKKGNRIWETPFGVRYYDDEPASVVQTPDEGFFITGWSKKDSGPVKQIHLAKIDKRGNIEWEKTHGGEQMDYARAGAITPDNRFIVAAVTRSVGQGEEDVRLIKLDMRGEIEWDKTYGGMRAEHVTAIIPDSDNGCVITGWTNSKGNGKENIFLARFDRKGNLLWERFPANYNWSTAESIIKSENGYVIAGWANSEEGDESDFLVLSATDNFDAQLEKEIEKIVLAGDTRSKDEIKKEVVNLLKSKQGSVAEALTQDDNNPVYRGSGDPLKGLNVSSIGNYYALIIGIDNYSGNWGPLKNAVRDANAVENILKTKYKFDHFKSLINERATRANIIREFEWLVENVTAKDNVFIYYSGHGEFKKNLDKGYWVPFDATSNSTTAYISNSDIQTFLNGIKSKHTLLVSDACFSGDIFRGNTISVPFEESDKYYAEVNALKSRQALTSGGVEPVMDGGKEGHSVFAYYFIQTLIQNSSKYFDAGQLFSKIKIPIVNNSEQTPNLNPVKNTGDEGGQFIFILK